MARSASRLIEYQQGTRDFTTVLTAEQNLYQAQNNLAIGRGQCLARVSRRSTGLSAAAGRSEKGNDFVKAADARRDARADELGQACCRPAEHAAAADSGASLARRQGTDVRAPEW